MDDMFVCQEDESCNKKYESKQSLKRHMRCKHPTSRPTPLIIEQNNGACNLKTPITANDMEEQEIFVCRDGDEPCSKKYRSQRSLVRHVRTKHQTSEPAALLSPTNASTQSYEPFTAMSATKRAGYDFLDGERDWEKGLLNRTDVADNEYRKSGDVQDQDRNYTIIKDYLTFCNDAVVEIHSLDLIALFLIKHSRIAKQNDANYLAATTAYADMLYTMNAHELQKLFNLSGNFYRNARKDGLFDWDCLVIAFTMAHNLLMKYPHLYPDIVDMLLDIFNLAGDDLTKLGGWNNFLKYSEKFYA